MALLKKLAASVLTLAAFLASPIESLAQTCNTSGGVAGGIGCATGGSKTNLSGSGGIITNLINTMIGVIGVVSVIMIVVGAFQLVTSSGNPESTKKAKNTILFAVVGVVIALLAFAIVNFVLKSI